MLSAPSLKTSTFAGTLAYRMRQAVQEAGKSLSRDFGDVSRLQARQANRTYFVARAREKASQLLCRTLQRAFPDWHYYEEDSAALEAFQKTLEIKTGEPSTAARSSQTASFFLATPLSGWQNFMAGLPFFAVGLTAMATPDDPVVFMVYDPVRHELFWAQKREAAWFDGQRLRLRSFEGWRGATLGLSPGAAARHPHVLAQGEPGEAFNLYLSESVALLTAWLGASRLDGLFLDESQPTESLAAATRSKTQGRHQSKNRYGGRIGWPGEILFLQLAGARLTDLQGAPIGPCSACELVGASQALHPALLAHLRRKPSDRPPLTLASTAAAGEPAGGLSSEHKDASGASDASGNEHRNEHRHERRANKLQQSPVFSRLAHRASLFAPDEPDEPGETEDPGETKESGDSEIQETKSSRPEKA